MEEGGREGGRKSCSCGAVVRGTHMGVVVGGEECPCSMLAEACMVCGPRELKSWIAP